jgi:hypothetical protein
MQKSPSVCSRAPEAGNGDEAGCAPLGYEIVCLNTVPSPKTPERHGRGSHCPPHLGFSPIRGPVNDRTGGRRHYAGTAMHVHHRRRFTEPNLRLLSDGADSLSRNERDISFRPPQPIGGIGCGRRDANSGAPRPGPPPSRAGAGGLTGPGEAGPPGNGYAA